MTSIRLRLLKCLIGPVLLLNLAGGVLAYVLAWVPVQSAFDQGLQDAAGALGARLGQGVAGLQIDLPRQAEQVLRGDAADAVYFVARDEAGRLIAGDADFPAPGLAPKGAAGMAYDASMRAEAVRIVAVRTRVGAHTVFIGVAKTLRKRLQSRAAIFRALILLESVFTLALIGLIWLSVGNGLRPLNRLRSDLNGRSGADLAPLPAEHVPFELLPLVHAFNGLLDKVRDGARTRHDFLANVAHQLRTPLAGLQSQLEGLGQRHAAQPETLHALRLMLMATERMTRQTNQLLAQARAEPGQVEGERMEAVALDRLVQESIQYFVGQAARKGIDLGYELRPTTVRGARFLLRDLIDNLVDNALRYTPEHGTVTVRCFPDGLGGLLVIEDSGPGIPPDKRERVFNRFVRLDEKSSGSGLGLAIVRDIAIAHGARIVLDVRPGGAGMLFSVRFPACNFISAK